MDKLEVKKGDILDTVGEELETGVSEGVGESQQVLDPVQEVNVHPEQEKVKEPEVERKTEISQQTMVEASDQKVEPETFRQEEEMSSYL